MNSQVRSSVDSYNVVALGFWLPCGRGNFYRRSDEDDELLELIKKCLATNNLSTEIKKKEGEKGKEYGTFESSIFSRYIKIFSEISTGKFIPVLSSAMQDFESDPESVIFYSEDLSQVKELKIHNGQSYQPIKKILFAFNNNGFNILFAIIRSIEIGKEKRKNEEEKIHKILSNFIKNKIAGSDNISISDLKKRFSDKKIDDNKKYNGILTFFQLNLVTEGLFNPDFHPGKFFDPSTKDEDQVTVTIKDTGTIDSEYSLNNFSDKIVARLSKTQDDSTNYLEIINFFESKDKYVDSEASNAFIFQKNDFAVKILGRFLKNISTDCLLDLKWSIESCRRSMLDQMIGSIHKNDELNQLEFNNSKAKYMAEANEAQLRGYTMLVSAKMPLILNISRYIESAYASCENSNLIQGLFEDWSRTVGAIDQNISRLENTISQSRTDSLLLEQQQIRAEQETMAEIERVRERKGSNNAGDGSSSAISLTNNLTAIMAFLLAVAIFIKITPYKGKIGEAEEVYIVFFKWLFNEPKSLEKICDFIRFFVIPLIPLVLLTLIYIMCYTLKIRDIRTIPRFFRKLNFSFFWRLVICFIIGLTLSLVVQHLSFDGDLSFITKPSETWHLIKSSPEGVAIFQIMGMSILIITMYVFAYGIEKFQTYINNNEIKKYYYEIDIRIQRPISTNTVNKIISDDFKSFFESNEILSIKRDSYKAEYLSDNEIHHKIYFEAEISLDTLKLGENEKTAYLTYEIIQQKRAGEQCYYFNEFRFVCVTDKKLENGEISIMKQIVRDDFINKKLDNKMNYLVNIFVKEKAEKK
jgi:hypothetical protein